MSKKVQQVAPVGNPEDLEGLHPVVAAISQIEFQGNLIPHAWCRSEKLRQPNGKPDSVAMLILADICYWYRATEKRDTSGKVVELRRKFGADMLQKAYKEWAEQFGLTKRQVQDAISFLIDRGLIRRELRCFEVRGVMLYNVTFFEPIAGAIRDLTATPLSRESGTPPTGIGDTPHENPGEGGRNNVIPLPQRRDTYTEITTETNPENKQRVGSVCVADATPADADTHTFPAVAGAARKKSRKKSVKAEEEEIRLAPDKMAAYEILRTYFPGLGTPSKYRDLARFVVEVGASPYGAALMCAWLESKERDFSFMTINLLRQLTEEFNADDKETKETARYLTHHPHNEKMARLMAIHDEWAKKYEKAKGAAK